MIRLAAAAAARERLREQAGYDGAARMFAFAAPHFGKDTAGGGCDGGAWNVVAHLVRHAITRTRETEQEERAERGSLLQSKKEFSFPFLQLRGADGRRIAGARKNHHLNRASSVFLSLSSLHVAVIAFATEIPFPRMALHSRKGTVCEWQSEARRRRFAALSSAYSEEEGSFLGS